MTICLLAFMTTIFSLLPCHTKAVFLVKEILLSFLIHSLRTSKDYANLKKAYRNENVLAFAVTMFQKENELDGWHNRAKLLSITVLQKVVLASIFAANQS